MIENDRSQGMKTEVAIIGLGPVGAMLSNLLGAAGVDAIVFEREADAYHLPRAVHFDDELMRIFQTIGLSDEIECDVILLPSMRFVDACGKLFLDWARTPEVFELG